MWQESENNKNEVINFIKSNKSEAYTVDNNGYVTRYRDKEKYIQTDTKDFNSPEWVTVSTYNRNGELNDTSYEPAIKDYFSDGNLRYKAHFKNGFAHRDNGPQYEFYSGDRHALMEVEYRQYGVLHREDGPALEHKKLSYQDARREFYVNGEKCENIKDYKKKLVAFKEAGGFYKEEAMMRQKEKEYSESEEKRRLLSGEENIKIPDKFGLKM